MHRPATSSLRLASPIANASQMNSKCETPPSKYQSCTRQKFNSDKPRPLNEDFVRRTCHLKDSPKASPRRRLINLDFAIPKATSLLKFSLHSTNRLGHRKSFDNGETILLNNKECEKSTDFESVIDLTTPTRDIILDHGLEGLQFKKSCMLGKGGFGDVLIAFRKGRKVAVKVITKISVRRSSCEASLLSEQNGMRLRHPNLVQTLDIFGFRQLHAIVIMEFAGRTNLNYILDDVNECVGKHRMLYFAFQIACGVSWCHRHQVAHFDIKPANVIVNENDWCKLGDFGCSVHLQKQIKGNYFPGGTVAYRAPELLTHRDYNEKADVYSLGVTFWQIMTRKVPFAGLDSHTIIYKVVAQYARPDEKFIEDPNLSKFIRLYREMWSHDQNRRPTIDQVVKYLKQLFISFS